MMKYKYLIVDNNSSIKPSIINKYFYIIDILSTNDIVPCYSRQIVSVIICPETYRIISFGYNGPPRGVPHSDSEDWLRFVFNNLLTTEEKINILEEFKNVDNLCKNMNGKCIRKKLGYRSGQRKELCNCEHSEKNCIINANSSVVGMSLLVNCSIPCFECSRLIVNSGIREVYYRIDMDEYDKAGKWILSKGGVELIGVKREEI